MAERRFAEGIYFQRPGEKSPAFVLGKISIKSSVFLDWFSGEAPNEAGYVNFDILVGRETGKPYIVVNDYKKNVTQETASNVEQPQEVSEDIPF